MKKCILVLLLLPLLLYSQTEISGINYGIFSSYGINLHNADFKRIPDCPSCSPGYKNGIGFGPTAGLVLDIPLSRNFNLTSKLFYKNISGELTNTETTTIIVNGTTQKGEFEHSFDATLMVAGIEPAIKYHLWGNLNINLGIFGSYLFKKDYSQVETIIKPSEFGTFLDANGNDTKSRERNKFSGTMSAANSMYIAPMLSLSYVLPLGNSGKWILEPEATFHYGLTNIVNDDLVNKWTVNSLSLGVSLKYALPPKEPTKEEYRKIENIDTMRIESDAITENKFVYGKAVSKTTHEELNDVIYYTEIINRIDTLYIPKVFAIDASITVVGVGDGDNKMDNHTFKIEEFVYNRLDPLLNYIFFEDNSAEIPNRYTLETNKDEFSMDSLYKKNTLGIYYDILNIVGARMQEVPTAKITLVACNSDVGSEENNKALSQKRAEAVKNYLVNIWKIAENRISVKFQNLPDKASTPKTDPDKIQENRRVEIYSDDFRITEPVFIENINRTANPAVARFKTSYESEAGLTDWEIVAYQNTPDDGDAFRINGKNNPPVQTDWILENDQLLIPKYEKPVKYQLSVTDKKGNHFTTDIKQFDVDIITVEEKRINKIDDYEIEKCSLILFDFDKYDISGKNKQIMDNIRKKIKPESIIEIKGYTDRTGDDAYNQTLSEQRANSAKQDLGRNDAVSSGIGELELLYNNDIPEGRFYCRTVEIIVKTKVQ